MSTSSSLSRDAATQWLNRQAATFRPALGRLLASGLLDALLALAQAALLAWTAACLLQQDPHFRTPALMLVAVLLVRTLNNGWRARSAAEVAVRMTQATRGHLLRHLLSQPSSTLNAGALSTLLIESTETVGRYHTGFALQRRIVAPATLIMLLAALAVDWMVGLIFLLTAPLIPLFMALVGSGAQRAADRQLQSLNYLGGHFLDRVRGAMTLRVFQREEAETRSVDLAAADFRQRTLSVLRIAFMTGAVLELFAALAVAMVALYVGLHLLGLVAFGPGPQLTFHSGFFLLLLAPEFYQPLRQLAATYHDRAGALAAAQSLRRLDAQPLPDDSDPDAPPGDLAVRNLSYRYPDSAVMPVQHVSLSLAAGECLVLRGDSGTGKSTLLRLLAGLLPPGDGQVLWSGRPDAFRHLAGGQIAWAGQHPWLPQGSVAQVLRQAAPQATDAALRAGLDQVGLYDIPLDRTVDEQGGGLSGGQRRRLALARALLSSASVLLLDEPTAELDPATEAAVLAALRACKGQRTLIIATHSEQCAQLADQCLWLGQEVAP